jgi:hypothetical protein
MEQRRDMSDKRIENLGAPVSVDRWPWSFPQQGQPCLWLSGAGYKRPDCPGKPQNQARSPHISAELGAHVLTADEVPRYNVDVA